MTRRPRGRILLNGARRNVKGVYGSFNFPMVGGTLRLSLGASHAE